MTGQQRKFLELAVIKQKPYPAIAKQMDVSREQLTNWWEELKTEREQMSKIRALWKRKCKEIPFNAFEDWYTNAVKAYNYCGITEEQILQLFQANQIKTKRTTTRGRRLEIERVEPNETYDNTENLVMCCYWCNNAKSDEFTKDEFMAIGQEIKKNWEKRLK